MFINNTLYHQREVLQARSWSITNVRSFKWSSPDLTNLRFFRWVPDLTNGSSFHATERSQFNCMTPSWWPCHKIVSVTFTFQVRAWSHQREVFQVRAWSHQREVFHVRSWSIASVKSFKWGPDRPTSLLCSLCHANDPHPISQSTVATVWQYKIVDGWMNGNLLQ